MAPAISQFLSNIVATFQNLHSSLGFLSPLETPGPGLARIMTRSATAVKFREIQLVAEFL